MSYGEKLTQIRKKSGMTQAELGNKLNVTYQAVSKWERGESEPDFATMSKIAKIFGVSLSYFEDDGEVNLSETAVTAPPAEEKKIIGTCTSCGRVIYEGEGESGENGKLVCRSCADKQRQAAEENKRRIEASKHAQTADLVKSRNRGLIWGGVAAAVVFVLCIVALCTGNPQDRGSIALGGVIMCICGFCTVSQLFWDGAVASVAMVGGKLVGMPGIIFSLDLDGIIFLVVMKILFAMLRMAIFIITFLFFVLLAAVISPFTFIPCFLRVNREIKKSQSGNA